MTAIDAESAITADVRGHADRTPGKYPVNLRFTVPFFPRSLFVTFIMGREKRSKQRRIEERAKHPVSTFGNLITVSTVLCTLQVAFLFVTLITVNLI
jgi:hypothetical protein